MDKQLKDLLKELTGKENIKQNTIDEINMELKRIDLREETETERFTKGINQDRNSGLYNNITDGEMEKNIDEELKNIKEKYDAERALLNQKLQLTEKEHEDEKTADYKRISSAIKEYHLDMVLEVNKANRELEEIEKQRDEKLAGIDKAIKEKQTEQNHLIMQNRNYIDLETTSAFGDIAALGQEIERLKSEKESVNNEYTSKIKPQSDAVQYYNQQKERAGKFLGQIMLSEKSIREIQEILFGEENEQNVEAKAQESESLNPEIVLQETEKEPEEREDEETEKELEETEKQESEEQEVTQTTSESPIQDPAQSTTTTEPKTTPTNVNNSEQNTTSTEETIPTHPVENQNQKINYKFSAKGIEYDGKKIDINKLLLWQEEYQEDIESAIESAMGDKEKISDFLRDSDKMIYLSIISGNTEPDLNGKMQLNAKAKERLEEYYKVWSEPTSQYQSKLSITYNFRGTSFISRFLNDSILENEDIKNIKDNAFETRNRKDVTIEDRLTRAEFAVREFLEDCKDKLKGKIKLLGAGKKEKDQEETESTLSSKMKDFRDRVASWTKLSDDKEQETQSSEKIKTATKTTESTEKEESR